MPLYIPNNPLVYTWDTKPAATIGIGTIIHISDVGINGSLWVSNGTTWTPSGPIILHNTYWGIIMHSMAAANAATYSQSGTTLTCTCTGHNIPATINDGKSIHLTPGAPSTGSQLATGLYTNFAYVDANTFTCTSTVSQTGTGPLNTNTSATLLPGISIPILGGLLGLNGWLDVYSYQQCNANANSKRMSFMYDGFSFKNPSPGPTTVSIQETHRLQNVNNVAKQVAVAVGTVGYAGNGINLPVTATKNTNNTLNITVNCTLAAALDFFTLDHLSIMLFSQ